MYHRLVALRKPSQSAPPSSRVAAAVTCVLFGVASVCVAEDGSVGQSQSAQSAEPVSDASAPDLYPMQLVAQANDVPAPSAAQAGGDDAGVLAAVTSETGQPRDQVVVTGLRRRGLEATQEVPASISVIDGDLLQDLGADSLRDIARRAANISRANTSNARSQALVVRGIGRRGSTEAQDPTVGINIDGIPYAYPGLAAWDFVDIDRVEVARGPQGTAGGHNPSFGLLTLTTKRPTFAPETEYSLRVGQRDTIFGTAAHGGPLIDDVLAWRGTFYVNKGLGAYSNDYWNGNQTYTDRLKISGKVQLLYTSATNYTMHLSADIQPRTFENDNGLNFFHAPPSTYSDGSPVNLGTDASTRLARRWFGQLESYSYDDNYLNYNSGTQNNDNQLPLITGTRGVGLTQTFDLPRDVTLMSITGFRDLDFEARNDEGTPFDISTQGGGGVRYQQFSQELRLSSSVGTIADYTTGLFFIDHQYEVDSKTGWGDDAGAWFANAAQYNLLDSDGDGRYLLNQSVTGLRRFSMVELNNKAYAVFGNISWHLGERVSLLTGLRLTREDRTSSAYASIENNGLAGGLNASISSYGVPLGGFDSYFNAAASAVWVRDGFLLATAGDTTGATLVAPGTTALTTSTLGGTRLDAAYAAADAAALKYFRTEAWADLSDRQKRQLAYAQAIRKAQLGLIHDTIVGAPFRETQYNFVISPSLRIRDGLTTYLSYQHGEKPGISQVVNGNSLLALGEEGNHFEVGVKASLFADTLQINADVFLSKLENYQQSSAVVDEFSTAFNNDGQVYYTTVAANVPKIQVHGLEVDASYNGIPNTNIAFSAAYNIARYKDFPSAPQTPENNYAGAPRFRSLTGKILPGAAKWSANLGLSRRYPAFARYDLHTDVNFNYISRYNSDITLSEYSWIEPYTIVDLGVGIGRRDRAFDVTLLAKNLTNAEGKAYNWLNGTLDTTPRWLGIVVSGRY